MIAKNLILVALLLVGTVTAAPILQLPEDGEMILVVRGSTQKGLGGLGKSSLSCLGIACGSGGRSYESDSDEDRSPRGIRSYHNPGGKTSQEARASNSSNQGHDTSSSDWDDQIQDTRRMSTDLGDEIGKLWLSQHAMDSQGEPSRDSRDFSLQAEHFNRLDRDSPRESEEFFLQAEERPNLPYGEIPVPVPRIQLRVLPPVDDERHRIQEQTWSGSVSQGNNLPPDGTSTYVVVPHQREERAASRHHSQEQGSQIRHSSRSSRLPPNLPKPTKSGRKGSSSKSGHVEEDLFHAEWH